MQEKDVLLLLTDQWADWEASYAVAEIHSAPGYTVKTIAEDKKPKASIGGLRAEIDLTLEEYKDFSNTALLILPGGFYWQRQGLKGIANFVREARDAGVPVAALCGATIFLARYGFLDDVRHTGDEIEFFLKEPGYRGAAHFVREQVVLDKNIITAHETAAVDFAYTLFSLLEIDSPSELDIWRENFCRGAFSAS